jgi:hypothetical protein
MTAASRGTTREEVIANAVHSLLRALWPPDAPGKPPAAGSAGS